jgi:hypothetical protein
VTPDVAQRVYAAGLGPPLGFLRVRKSFSPVTEPVPIVLENVS